MNRDTSDIEAFATRLFDCRPDQLGEPLRRALADPAAVFKSASGPALLTQTGWAAELNATHNFTGPLADLAPQSLYAQLASRGQRGIFQGNGTVKFPNRAASPSMGGAWTGESGAITIGRGAFGSVLLTGFKLAVISVFSAEVASRSTPEIEGIIRQAIAEDTSLALDASLIDTTAASAIRPAGLLFNVTPLAAATGGSLAALATDLSTLAGAIGNPTDLVYLASAAERVRMLALAPGLASITVIEAPLPAKQIVALDAADLCTAENDTVDIRVSYDALYHDEDTLPLAISVPGTPNVVSAPTRSLLQTDSVALRLRQFIGWAMRRTGRVQTISGVTW
jgi:hypothetical protein